MASQEGSTTTTLDPNPLRGGIRCPECHCPHHSVTNTYQSETCFHGVHRQYIRRRRQCRHCLNVWYTREVNEPEIPDEIKSPGDQKTAINIIRETLKDIIPSREGNLPNLPNPFLPE